MAVTPAEIIRDARLAAGASASEVARRAGVATTTVTRTESGTMNPTISMLEKLLNAVDYRLIVAVEKISNETISELTNAWTDEPWGCEIEWTRLRAFVDHLLRKPELTRIAIEDVPKPSGFNQLDVMLAAVAEKLADDAGIKRPNWCKSIPPLGTKLLPIGTPRMVKVAIATAPKQFKERNIYLSGREIWRHKGG
jgi:transcriptional regulator with XRE-family HTH domain